jgi:hypothetical protein
VTQESVEAGLRAVAEPFATGPAAGGVTLRWGPLYAALAGDDETYVEAIELIHEGYLVHYRRGRLAVVADGDRQTALLAGDVFYARGLRLIADRGDVSCVALLTRLMSACSCLRTLAMPFAADDALWAYTMAAMAAVRAGVALTLAEAFFDDIDAALAVGAPEDVPGRAAAAAAGLGLPDTAPLEAEFAALGPVADVPTSSPL